MTETYLRPDVVFWDGQLRNDLAIGISSEGKLLPARPASEVPNARPLPHRAIFPGLVNAHSHAFQRLIRGRTEYVAQGRSGDDFWSWRESMYQAAEALAPEEIYVASRQAFVEMALAGITSVGEFHYLHHQVDGKPYADRNELAHQVIRAATDVGIRICLLRVGYARSGFQVVPNPRQRRFIDANVDEFLRAADDLGVHYRGNSMVSIGLGPHSVRAVTREWLEALSGRREILHMHVAEQPAEVQACQAEHGRTPVALLSELGLLRPGFTAVHAIHLDEADIAALGRSGAAVCACPSTEANLGDGLVPADALSRANVPLCLGSDSQATIDLLGEARLMESHLRLVRQRRAVLDPGGGAKDGLARKLLEVASRGGAQCLGLASGELTAGAPADFFAVNLEHPSLAGASADTLIPAVVFGAERNAIDLVCVEGRIVVEGGRHRVQEQSGREMAALTRKLFS